MAAEDPLAFEKYQTIRRASDGVLCDTNGMSLVGWHNHGGAKTEIELQRAMSFLDINTEHKSYKRFCDIFRMTADGRAFHACCEQMAEEYEGKHFDRVVGTESRGFIFGCALACKLGAGFVPVRKAGKLPGKVLEVESQVQYAKNQLETSSGYFEVGDRVLYCDDLIATGNTAKDSIELIKKAGGKVTEAVFLISIPSLGGEELLKKMGVRVYKLFDMEGDISVIKQWFIHTHS
ncbi:adenine phosphoribosyltransferase [Parashewanella tropica]|uniref:adenine phosphoribosyltransferase n=1 Tax=Parashewanella tropica TaxID=2547970 RepID=UPI00105A07CA|nr:adenine phosphoribosyltransferase [Parashewanella tropica]